MATEKLAQVIKSSAGTPKTQFWSTIESMFSLVLIAALAGIRPQVGPQQQYDVQLHFNSTRKENANSFSALF